MSELGLTRTSYLLSRDFRIIFDKFVQFSKFFFVCTSKKNNRSQTWTDCGWCQSGAGLEGRAVCEDMLMLVAKPEVPLPTDVPATMPLTPPLPQLDTAAALG